MTQTQRMLLAIAIVVVDAIAFVVPLAALFLAYVVIVNPPWFRGFVNGLDRAPPGE